jgi:hypothetical protein
MTEFLGPEPATRPRVGPETSVAISVGPKVPASTTHEQKKRASKIVGLAEKLRFIEDSLHCVMNGRVAKSEGTL